MITKKQSKMLQGIAILLMMYHHFFMYPETSLFSYSNVDFARKAAWFAKICVGLFSFISGYGMCIALSGQRKNVNKNLLLQEYKNVATRMLKLLLKLWIVIIIYQIICTAFYKEQLNIKMIAENMFLINFSINGSWWFVRQYLFFMIIAPVLEYLCFYFSKKGKTRIIAGMCVILIMAAFVYSKIFVPQMDTFYDFIQPTFIMVFVTGYICKNYDLFSYIEKIKFLENNAISVLAGIISLVISIVIRVATATDPSYAKLDFILVPIFSIGIILTLGRVKILADALSFVGNNATFMWLIHVLVYERTIDFLVGINNSHIFFYFVELVLSFIISLLLTTICGMNFRKEKKND